jgi:hypothetical protein
MALGQQHGAASHVKMCELSELSELSVLVLRFRRGEVCALSAISPPFRVGRGGTTCFSARINDGRPPVAGPMPGCLWCQVFKDLPIVRGRLGALLLITRSSAHSADSSLGEGTQNGKRGIRLLAMSSFG